MNKSPASSNPSVLVGVHRGHTRAPETMARRANDEVDNGELRGGRGSSWGGRNRRRPSSPEAACSGAIPAMRCSSCSGTEVGWFWVREEWNGMKNSSGGVLLL